MGDEKFEAARTCIRKASAAARLHADKLSIGKLGRHNVCSRTNQNVRLAEPDVIAVTSVDHNLAFQIDEIDRADHAFATTPSPRFLLTTMLSSLAWGYESMLLYFVISLERLSRH